MSKIPSAASLLIDALRPKERAVLHASLHSIKESIEQDYNHHITHNEMMNQVLAGRVAKFYQWQLKELNKIMNTLFADCFLDDLNPGMYFDQEQPISQTTNTTAQAIGQA